MQWHAATGEHAPQCALSTRPAWSVAFSVGVHFAFALSEPLVHATVTEKSRAEHVDHGECPRHNHVAHWIRLLL